MLLIDALTRTPSGNVSSSFSNLAGASTVITIRFGLTPNFFASGGPE